MKHVDEYRDSGLSAAVAGRIRKLSTRPASFMEFCGGHTATIARYGLESLLPAQISLLSGPGCPVCVTPVGMIDRMIALARLPGMIVASYGDMLRVPGSASSLLVERGRGSADVRVVYSSYDALEAARSNPGRQVVFFGIGFETTAPATAAVVLKARELGVDNFSVVSAHKTTPGIIRALLDSDEVKLDGLICPGHVSVITGTAPYRYAAEQRRVPCVICGFEPLDVLQSVLMLVEQVESHRAGVEIQYRRGVREQGNEKARRLMDEVFEPADSVWRGIGTVPGTGLSLRPELSRWDALARYRLDLPEPQEPAGCICGKILRGAASPEECRLFGSRCTPATPVGACMVSGEGACQVRYRWRRHPA
ncbi:MAG: hydrogenase formation protein HypD [Candidatus Glassbacteria bacterium]|nr:hydrogenase formation protein HypD [Candidatus Glassbacteria bacterium]